MVTTATQGQPFSQTFTASGGSSPYSYSLASGTLPAGLSLSPSGVLSGMPTQTGSFSLSVQVTDANGCAGVGGTYTLTVNQAQAQCPTGDVTLSSQAQVDAFPAGCPNISGRLIISGADITSLTALSQIRTVGSTLNIHDNPNLSSLTGLERLTSVDGDVGIYNSPGLTSLNGLNALTTVRNTLNIHDNPNLSSLTGLEKLNSVQGDVQVYNSPGLTSLNGLNALTTVGGTLSIHDNPNLSSLTGLEKLNSVGGDVGIYNSPSLTSLNGLNALTTVRNTLNIHDNPNLSSLTGLEKLNSVQGDVQVYNSPGLTSLNGLNALTTVGGTLSIHDNPNLSSLTGLEKLSRVGGDFGIYNSPGLTSLNGLNALTSVGGNLSIHNNTSLSTCAIESICNLLATSVRRSIYSNAPGCNSSAEVQALCNGLAITGFAASPDVVCVGSPVTFTATATNVATPYSYTLSNGSSLTGTASSQAFSQRVVASGSGSQSFTLTVSSGGQTATATTSITVNALPMATISGNTTVTSGGSTTLTVSGGTSQTWSTGETTPSITVMAGTYSVTVTNASGCSSSTSVTVSTVNSAPVATANANQTATVGVPFSYTVNAFTDADTPNQLTYTASISPANGFSFDPNTRIISGTPSMSGVSSVSVTATDPGSLSASTSFTITVNPASVNPPPPTPIFSITGVTTLSCQVLSPGERRVTFNPRYAGLDGSPVSFSVVNELLPTTNPGPYTLNLYTDNSVITLQARQSGASTSFAYNWLSACSSSTGNTPPTVASPVPPQSATVGIAYTLSLAGVFTDAETPNSLVLSVTGLPAGLSFVAPSTISGTPSMSGVSTVTVTATDPGSMSASTSFTLTVNPAAGTPPPPTGTFSITSVQTISCEVLSAGQRRLTFNPQYAGLNGAPVSFSVVNELAPTTNPGPYTLNLYTDNPVITLRAVQSGIASSFAYNWLSACSSSTGNTPPTVANPVSPQSATVGVGYTLSLTGVFTDAETPNQLTLMVSNLPAGLSFTAPSTISGTPSMSGVSTVSVTATDPGGMMASTSFSITVNPAGGTPPPPRGTFSITGVQTISCEVLSAGQRRVTFNPQYSGLDGSPVSFSVVNELAPDHQAGSLHAESVHRQSGHHPECDPERGQHHV